MIRRVVALCGRLLVRRDHGQWAVVIGRPGAGRGAGIDDPREAEGWGARLHLVEELAMARMPEVAAFPPVLRAIARISARSARLARIGDRVLRYSFGPPGSPGVEPEAQP